jgi:hypothetical protein
METSIDPAFLASLIETLAGSWPTDSGEDTVMAAHAAIVALAPRDLVEAMLAGRMIAAHHATLDSYRRAMLPDLGDADAVRLRNNAIALGRSFDAALRMLEKRRALADGLAQPPRPARRHAGLPRMSLRSTTGSPASRRRRSPRRNTRWTTIPPSLRRPSWRSASRCIATRT